MESILFTFPESPKTEAVTFQPTLIACISLRVGNQVFLLFDLNFSFIFEVVNPGFILSC